MKKCFSSLSFMLAWPLFIIACLTCLGTFYLGAHTTTLAVILGAHGLLFILLTCLFKRHVTRPLNTLNDALVAVARGDYSTNITPSSLAEIKKLTEALTYMRDTIQSGKSRLEDEVEKAMASNEAKSDFLANMSHELRTPMNGVLGMVEMLRDTPMNNEQVHFAAQIQSSAENLLVILNDILDFSKIEANALELEHTPYTVPDSVEDVLTMLHPLAQEKGLTLHTDIPDHIPAALMGDPGRVRQILINLVGNAIKFTPTGSVTVALTTENVNQQSLLKFSVHDTGIGIAADKIDSIFQKFTQADASNTRKFGGTGLGLAITQSLVELMGGQIGVTSELGQGSCFYFTLPCLLPSDEDLTKLASKTEDYGAYAIDNIERLLPQDVNILLVEDDLMNQEVARRLLAKLGLYNIDTAENGQDGVAMYMPELHNFILMDCQMPGMDGFDATREIRLREEDMGVRIPIVALTANAMVGDREKCLAAGMDEYLSKPIKLDKLQRLLSQWIDFSGLAKQAEEVATEEHHQSSYSPVDTEHLAMFTDGDRAQEIELFGLFFDTAYMCVRQLEEHVATGENDAWKAIAHRLKGASANLGANYLAETARVAEEHSTAAAEPKTAMLRDITAQFDAVIGFAEQTYGIERRA